jgi:hypothetical protein
LPRPKQAVIYATGGNIKRRGEAGGKASNRAALATMRFTVEHREYRRTKQVTGKRVFCYRGASSGCGYRGRRNSRSYIYSNDGTGAAMQFRVIWEIDIDAEGPKEAAREARVIQLTPGMSATVFDVWAYVTEKMHRIDLVEEADRLDRDELFAVRAGLRLLQCAPETPPSVQEIATMLLIFLDRDNKMFKRVDRGPSW